MTTRGLFIIGTDTGVGKTVVTCIAARESHQQGFRVGVYKPVCSGGTRKSSGELVWDDVLALERTMESRFPSERICPQRFEAPLAPPLAAKCEGRTVDAQLLRDGARWWEGRVDVLLMEGVGGLLCPLTADETVADLALDLGYPLLIVARRGLGTINHTLLTFEAAERRGLPIAGIILNEPEPLTNDRAAETNEQEIASRCRAPVLGVLRHGGRDGFERLNRPAEINWGALAQLPVRSA